MADVTISELSPLTPSVGLTLPVSNGSTTGNVTLSQVCGVMTSSQITTALGYTPYNGTTNPNAYITASSLPVSQQLVKAWGVCNSAGTLIKGYNMASAGRFGVGRYIFYFASNMSDANYVAIATPGKSTSYADDVVTHSIPNGGNAVGSIQIHTAKQGTDWKDVFSLHVAIFN
jgi:hypothetical protein